MKFTIKPRKFGDERDVVMFAWFPCRMTDEKTWVWLERYVKRQRVAPSYDANDDPRGYWATYSVVPYESKDGELLIDKIATWYQNIFVTAMFMLVFVYLPIMALKG